MGTVFRSQTGKLLWEQEREREREERFRLSVAPYDFLKSTPLTPTDLQWAESLIYSLTAPPTESQIGASYPKQKAGTAQGAGLITLQDTPHALFHSHHHPPHWLPGLWGKLSFHVPKTRHKNTHPLQKVGEALRQGSVGRCLQRFEQKTVTTAVQELPCGSLRRTAPWSAHLRFPHSAPAAWQKGFESATLLLVKVGQETVQKPHFFWTKRKPVWQEGGKFETSNIDWNQGQECPLNPRKVQ